MKIDSSTGTHAGGPGNCEVGVRSRKPGDRKSGVERAQGQETMSKEPRNSGVEISGTGNQE